MIDTCSIPLMNIPFKILSAVIKFADSIMAGTNDKIYILDPSYWLLAGWNLIKSLLTKEQN